MLLREEEPPKELLLRVDELLLRTDELPYELLRADEDERADELPYELLRADEDERAGVADELLRTDELPVVLLRTDDEVAPPKERVDDDDSCILELLLPALLAGGLFTVVRVLLSRPKRVELLPLLPLRLPPNDPLLPLRLPPKAPLPE